MEFRCFAIEVERPGKGKKLSQQAWPALNNFEFNSANHEQNIEFELFSVNL